MNVQDVLALRVRLDNVEQVVAGLGRVTRSTEAAAVTMDRAAIAGMGFAAAGIGIAAAALRANSELAKVSVQLEALYGKAAGSQMVAGLKDLAAGSAQTFDELAAGVRQLANAGFSPDKLLPTMAEISNMSALGANVEGVARAIAQMKSSGVIFGEELNQLVDAGFALDLVAKKMGMTKRELMGGKVSADAFLAAMSAANKELGNVGAQMLARDPLAAMQKALAGIAQSLAPTGVMLAKVLAPGLALVNALVSAFAKLNDLLGGLPAFAVSIGLLVAGLAKIGPLIEMSLVAGWMQTVQFMASAVTWLRAVVTLEKARAIWTALSAIATGALSAAAGNPMGAAAVAAGVAVLGAAGYYAYKASQPDAAGSPAPAKVASSAERPHRRSSVENMYYRMYGGMA